MITFLLAVDIPVMVSTGINISGIQFTLRGTCDDPNNPDDNDCDGTYSYDASSQILDDAPYIFNSVSVTSSGLYL